MKTGNLIRVCLDGSKTSGQPARLSANIYKVKQVFSNGIMCYPVGADASTARLITKWINVERFTHTGP